jgi:GNAT superfamily N-acetyltransferase
MIEVLRHLDARSFLTRAEAWLGELEIEHGVALGSARQARIDDSRYQKPVYWATIEDAGNIVGCAYRTPPYRLGITAVSEAAIEPLVANVSTVYGTLSGVSGPEPTASQFAAAWAARHGITARVVISQRLYAFAPAAVPSATPAGAPAGALRLASANDAALVASWSAAFLAETGLRHVDASVFDQFMKAGQLHLWADPEPRCMAATIRHTASGAVIGVLYTPGNWRRRDFARATLSALTRHLQQRGAGKCYLYADPGNHGAAAVADRVGYRPVHDAVDIDFR